MGNLLELEGTKVFRKVQPTAAGYTIITEEEPIPPLQGQQSQRREKGYKRREIVMGRPCLWTLGYKQTLKRGEFVPAAVLIKFCLPVLERFLKICFGECIAHVHLFPLLCKYWTDAHDSKTPVE